DCLRHELKDDPEERPDRRADEQPRRQRVLGGRMQACRTRDEDDRECLSERPDHEGQAPQEGSLREVDVPLDDPEQADELVAHLDGVLTHANTSRYSSSSSWPSFSNSRPVAAKNACSSVGTPKRRFTSSTGSRKSSRPRSRIPTRSASVSASAMSCVQRRIVASCSVRTARMNSCTSSFERGSSPVVGSSSRSRTGEVRSALARATFCCIPRDRCSIDPPRRSGGKPTLARISGTAVRVWRGVIP